ncbi:hypothetical protein V6N13_138388 [Hibiscus sabdariffa]
MKKEIKAKRMMEISSPKISESSTGNPSVKRANHGLRLSAGGVVGRPPDNTRDGLATTGQEGKVSEFTHVVDAGMVGVSIGEILMDDTVVEIIESETTLAKGVPTVSFRDMLVGSNPAYSTGTI